MGVLITNCCLNLPPPLTDSSSPNSINVTSISCITPKDNNRSWKRQCVIGLTCAILGFEVGNLVLFIGNQDAAGAAVAAAVDVESSTAAVESKVIKVHRWSDRRSCAPWRINSLETIVPENLPRPSARRRSEGIQLPPEAPPSSIVLEPKSGTKTCFSL